MSKRQSHGKASGGYELRITPTAEGREVRMEPGEDGKPDRIVGYAAVFDSPTTLWPGYREVVRRGAFTKTLAEGDVRGLFNHDPNFVLGRNRSGTMRLVEDEIGLRYEIDAPATPTIRDLVLSPLERRDVSGSSFGFRAMKAPETANEVGEVLRELTEVQLFDVGPVTFPAYEATQSEVRESMLRLAGEPPEISVAALRARGLTDSEIREKFEGAIASLSEPAPVRHSDAAKPIASMRRSLAALEL